MAYFDDDRVSEPGFYALSGEHEISTVVVQDGGELQMEGGEPVVDERGRPIILGVPQVVDEIEVKHETEMVPGERVYPDPEGGWVYKEGGDE